MGIWTLATSNIIGSIPAHWSDTSCGPTSGASVRSHKTTRPCHSSFVCRMRTRSERFISWVNEPITGPVNSSSATRSPEVRQPVGVEAGRPRPGSALGSRRASCSACGVPSFRPDASAIDGLQFDRAVRGTRTWSSRSPTVANPPARQQTASDEMMTQSRPSTARVIHDGRAGADLERGCVLNRH
jgi:hypothetical protein